MDRAYDEFMAEAENLRVVSQELQHDHRCLQSEIDEKQASIRQLSLEVEIAFQQQATIQQKLDKINRTKRTLITASRDNHTASSQSQERLGCVRSSSSIDMPPVPAQADAAHTRVQHPQRSRIVIDLDEDADMGILDTETSNSGRGCAVQHELENDPRDESHPRYAIKPEQSTARKQAEHKVPRPGRRSRQPFQARQVESIHAKFPTVFWIEGAWVEVTCAVCGANHGSEAFFRNFSSFTNHYARCHRDVPYEGLGFCKMRVVSKRDVHKMKYGQLPEVRIMRTRTSQS